jgi:hypothetical protein
MGLYRPLPSSNRGSCDRAVLTPPSVGFGVNCRIKGGLSSSLSYSKANGGEQLQHVRTAHRQDVAQMQRL